MIYPSNSPIRKNVDRAADTVKNPVCAINPPRKLMSDFSVKNVAECKISQISTEATITS